MSVVDQKERRVHSVSSCGSAAWSAVSSASSAFMEAIGGSPQKSSRKLVPMSGHRLWGYSAAL
jgi:hypothetical protein